MKPQRFNNLLKEQLVKIILEQDPAAAGVPPPPPPADPTSVSAANKEDIDPIQFVASRVKALIDTGAESIIKEIAKNNSEARKPLQLKSVPIDQTKNVEDFIKSFKNNYSKDYFLIRNFIDATTEGSVKYEQLKTDINTIIKLGEKHLDTRTSSVEPSDMESAPI